MNKIELLHRICLWEPNSVVSVVCPSLSGLRALWSSSESVFLLGAKRRNKVEYTWEYSNGSVVLFQHFDEQSMYQDLHRDYLYTFDTLNSDIYSQLRARTSKMVFLEITSS